MKVKKKRRIYCKYCGAKLIRDCVGWKCPTRNCQWEHGIKDDAAGRRLVAKREGCEVEAGLIHTNPARPAATKRTTMCRSMQLNYANAG